MPCYQSRARLFILGIQCKRLALWKILWVCKSPQRQSARLSHIYWSSRLARFDWYPRLLWELGSTNRIKSTYDGWARTSRACNWLGQESLQKERLWYFNESRCFYPRELVVRVFWNSRRKSAPSSFSSSSCLVRRGCWSAQISAKTFAPITENWLLSKFSLRSERTHFLWPTCPMRRRGVRTCRGGTS